MVQSLSVVAVVAVVGVAVAVVGVAVVVGVVVGGVSGVCDLLGKFEGEVVDDEA